MSGYTSFFFFWLGGNVGSSPVVQAATAIVGAITVYPTVLGMPSVYAAVDGEIDVYPAVDGRPRKR